MLCGEDDLQAQSILPKLIDFILNPICGRLTQVRAGPAAAGRAAGAGVPGAHEPGCERDPAADGRARPPDGPEQRAAGPAGAKQSSGRRQQCRGLAAAAAVSKRVGRHAPAPAAAGARSRTRCQPVGDLDRAQLCVGPAGGLVGGVFARRQRGRPLCEWLAAGRWYRAQPQQSAAVGGSAVICVAIGKQACGRERRRCASAKVSCTCSCSSSRSRTSAWSAELQSASTAAAQREAACVACDACNYVLIITSPGV